MQIQTEKKKRKQQSVKSFRLRTTYVFLTYPKCSIPLLDLFDQLTSKLFDLGSGIIQYIIAHELHEDGTPHRHCWFELSHPPGQFPHHSLNVNDDGEVKSGEYEDCKDAARVAKYCIKDGDYITSFGPDELQKFISKVKPLPISKHEVAVQMLNGIELHVLVQKHPALLWEYKKLKDAFDLFRRDVNKATPRERLDNIWYWGPPGSGKTTRAWADYPMAFKKEKSEWWNGYNYEEAVIFEDVDESWEMILWSFKEWFDYKPFPARCKHERPMVIRPKCMIVTSNYDIRTVVTMICENKKLKFNNFFVQALERRFNQIRITDTDTICDNIEFIEDFPEHYFK